MVAFAITLTPIPTENAAKATTSDERRNQTVPARSVAAPHQVPNNATSTELNDVLSKLNNLVSKDYPDRCVALYQDVYVAYTPGVGDTCYTRVTGKPNKGASNGKFVDVVMAEQAESIQQSRHPQVSSIKEEVRRGLKLAGDFFEWIGEQIVAARDVSSCLALMNQYENTNFLPLLNQIVNLVPFVETFDNQLLDPLTFVIRTLSPPGKLKLLSLATLFGNRSMSALTTKTASASALRKVTAEGRTRTIGISIGSGNSCVYIRSRGVYTARTAVQGLRFEDVQDGAYELVNPFSSIEMRVTDVVTETDIPTQPPVVESSVILPKTDVDDTSPSTPKGKKLRRPVS